MFYGCSSLKSINLSNFDTKNVINLNSMFYGCSSLKSIDLFNFNTSKISDMNYIFYNCKSLSSINIKNFYTNSTVYLFNENCYMNGTIYTNKNIYDKMDNTSRKLINNWNIYCFYYNIWLFLSCF